jgi:hypothetical protein
VKKVRCFFHGNLVEFCDPDECYFWDNLYEYGGLDDIDPPFGTVEIRFCPVIKDTTQMMFVGINKDGSEISKHHNNNHGWSCLHEED